MERVYGKGLNIAAQINKTRVNLPKWTPIEELDGHTVASLGCGYLQSTFLLTNGQMVKNGSYYDTLTNVRLINMYRLLPRVFRGMQKLKFMGKLLSFRAGEDELTRINGVQMQNNIYFKKAVFGHAGIQAFDQDGNMWVLGQNYFGQRGTGDCVTNQSNFRKIQHIKILTEEGSQSSGQKQRFEKIKDISLGFQHTLIITDNGLYGCGKADSYQIQPYRYHHYNDVITTDKFEKPELIWGRSKVVKAACGYKHSIFLTERGQLYALGLNYFGQCGYNYSKHPHLTKVTQVFFPYREGEEIIDIQCGSYHTLILTNMAVYFMGSIKNNQNPFVLFKENVSSPSIMNIPGKPIRIFAQFDRSAVITQDGKAYIFGGKDLSEIGGESGKLEIVDDWKLNEDSLIGLGFSHTIISP